MEFKGPQSFSDASNTQLLHYYGKGWIKWFKKSIFEAQIEKVFGVTDAPIIKLLLHGSDPWTERVSLRVCEKLLQMTQDVISRNLARENWQNKLTPFSGPQCHEDRGKDLYEYNPDIRMSLENLKTTKSVTERNVGSRPTNKDPPGVTSVNGNMTANNEFLVHEFINSSLRICRKCFKTRVLDKRARYKYPLGYFVYGGKENRVLFECNRLVSTDCDTK